MWKIKLAEELKNKGFFSSKIKNEVIKFWEINSKIKEDVDQTS